MAFKTTNRSFLALLIALACTLGMAALTLAPAPKAYASCSGIVECLPGEQGIRNSSYCCCVGKKLRQKSTCTSNCTWGPWTDLDCNGSSCTPHGICA